MSWLLYSLRLFIFTVGMDVTDYFGSTPRVDMSLEEQHDWEVRKLAWFLQTQNFYIPSHFPGRRNVQSWSTGES